MYDEHQKAIIELLNRYEDKFDWKLFFDQKELKPETRILAQVLMNS